MTPTAPSITRRLIIMRHAKSAWNTGASSDHERPLNGRGRRDAPHLGRLIAARGFVPQVVVSSDSTRTRETWDGLMESMPPALEPRFTSMLYLSGLAEIRDEIGGLADEVTSALLLGHNPGFSLAASWLTGNDIELKTAFAAVLETEGARWSETLKLGRWRLRDLLTPHSRL